MNTLATAQDILRIALLNGEAVGGIRAEGNHIEVIEPTPTGFNLIRAYWYDAYDWDMEIKEFPSYMLDAAIDSLKWPIGAAANVIAGVYAPTLANWGLDGI